MIKEDQCAASRTSNPAPSYTVFSVPYRWYLTILLGYLCLASSLTANIYFPLVEQLAIEYETSFQAINLTITVYVVVQGIAPSIFSPLSDTLGRRPVYLMSFLIYTIASIGLVFSNHNYVALLVLRAMQNFSVHAERGRFLGPMMVATNLGPSIGPVIGGGTILATGNSRWAFWTLAIFGATALGLISWSMRETNRTVVSNGSVSAKGIWRAWIDFLPKSSLIEAEPLEDYSLRGINGKGKLSVPNPLQPLRILMYKDVFTALYLAASPYASWYTVTTSIPLIYGIEYGFNGMIVGCCYLAGGAGILAGGFIAGRTMDWNYEYTAKEAGLSVDRVAGDDIRRFPIERARSRGSYTFIFLSAFVFTGYGWVVQNHVHVAVPLILQFYLGAKATVVHQIYSALIIDIFPDNPGSADAANNIFRCALSAAWVAALQPLVDALGRSWVFTLIGLWDAVGSIVAVYVLRQFGPVWREMRSSRN